MASSRKSPTPPPEEPKTRPIMNFGPYPSDRNTSIEAAIWQNEIDVESGTITTYNVTIKRSYRDESGTWKPNQNYRPHDLPILSHALQKAHSFILEKKNPNSEE
jgi:hypothetical protein